MKKILLILLSACLLLTFASCGEKEEPPKEHKYSMKYENGGAAMYFEGEKLFEIPADALAAIKLVESEYSSVQYDERLSDKDRADIVGIIFAAELKMSPVSDEDRAKFEDKYSYNNLLNLRRLSVSLADGEELFIGVYNDGSVWITAPDGSVYATDTGIVNRDKVEEIILDSEDAETE